MRQRPMSLLKYSRSHISETIPGLYNSLSGSIDAEAFKVAQIDDDVARKTVSGVGVTT